MRWQQRNISTRNYVTTRSNNVSYSICVFLIGRTCWRSWLLLLLLLLVNVSVSTPCHTMCQNEAMWQKRISNWNGCEKSKIQSRTHSYMHRSMYDVTRHVKLKQWLLNLVANRQMAKLHHSTPSITYLCAFPPSLSVSLVLSAFFSQTHALTFAGLMNMNSSHFIFFSIGVRMFDFFFSFKLYIFRTLSRILSFSTAHILRWLVFVMARSDRSFVRL